MRAVRDVRAKRMCAAWRRLRTDFVMGNVSSFAALTDALTVKRSMNESDGCASASLGRVVCDNQRGPAKDDCYRDDND